MAAAPRETPSWPRRIGWLVLIWTVSVVALGAVALLFRILMNMVGLTA
ncbi:DUF2474 domain-containing protein [Pseudaminobacter sp. NGMCC 1.201702]